MVDDESRGAAFDGADDTLVDAIVEVVVSEGEAIVTVVVVVVDAIEVNSILKAHFFPQGFLCPSKGNLQQVQNLAIQSKHAAAKLEKN